MSKGKIIVSWEKDDDAGTNRIFLDTEGDPISHWETQGILFGLMVSNHNFCISGEGESDGTTDNNYADESASGRG